MCVRVCVVYCVQIRLEFIVWVRPFNERHITFSLYTKLFMSTYHRISIFMRSYRFTSFIVGLNWLADTYTFFVLLSTSFRFLLSHTDRNHDAYFLSHVYITSRRILYALFNAFAYTYKTEYDMGEHWENERLSLSSTSLVSGQHNVWNASIFIVLIGFFTLFYDSRPDGLNERAQNFYLHSLVYLIQTLCSDSVSLILLTVFREKLSL